MTKDDTNEIFKSQQKVSLINLLTEIPNAVAQLVVAVLSGSLLIALDAVDSLCNVIQTAMSVILSKKLQGDDRFKYDYGMGKIEAFGSFIASILMYIALIAVLAVSVYSLIRPRAPQDLLFLAIFIKIINVIFDAFLLHRQIKTVKNVSGSFVQSNVMLLKKNLVFDSVTLVAITLVFLLRGVDGIVYFEPIVCILCALYLAYQNLSIIKNASSDLLDKTLDEETQLKILKCVSSIWDQVNEFHAVRTRRSGHVVYIDLFVSFDSSSSYEEIINVFKIFDKAVSEVIPNSISAIIIGETKR